MDKGLVCIIHEEAIADFYNEVSDELKTLGYSISPVFVEGSSLNLVLRHSKISQEISGDYWVVLLDNASPCKEDKIIWPRLHTHPAYKEAKILAQTIHILLL